MQLQKIEDHLKSLDIPSFSVSGVIVELGQQELSLNQSLEQIEKITGTRPNVTDIHEARLMYQYLIQDGLRLHKQGAENVDTQWILGVVHNKATLFKTRHPYVFATGEGETKVNVKVDARGNVKQKKGWKQARVIELRNANPNMDHTQLIQMFMKECDMTKACATTYYHLHCKEKK